MNNTCRNTVWLCPAFRLKKRICVSHESEGVWKQKKFMSYRTSWLPAELHTSAAPHGPPLPAPAPSRGLNRQHRQATAAPGILPELQLSSLQVRTDWGETEPGWPGPGRGDRLTGIRADYPPHRSDLGSVKEHTDRKGLLTITNLQHVINTGPASGLLLFIWM